ncbi:hypothetical protein V12B01_12560 [Vibrio splendidus 12B01]|nr:hypothetical protein V12B01_12560 [Vibrio splendidus 12B01]
MWQILGRGNPCHSTWLCSGQLYAALSTCWFRLNVGSD